MKTTTLVILVAVTAAVGVGAAIVSTRGRAENKSVVATDYLFPDLGAKLNSVEAVSIKKSGSEFTFKKGAQGWEVTDKGGYPAKGEKVGEVLRGLTQLRKIEAKTSKPENYDKIGVEDPANSKPPAEGAPASSATLVTLKDAGGQVVSSIILGNPKWEGKGGMYIRKATEPQSWLAEGRIDIPMGFTGWVDSSIPSLTKERIKRAELTSADGTKTRISREKKEDTTFVVHDIPPGEELESTSSGDVIAMAMSGLSFEDVAPASQLFPPPAGDDTVKPGPSGEFETFDGMKVMVQTVDKAGKLWASFVATFEEPPAPAPVEGAPPPPAPEKKPEEVQKEVMDFNGKTAKWAFQLPEYKAGAFKTTVTAMLKSTPPAPPPSLNQGNPAANMNPSPLPPPSAPPQPQPEPTPAPQPAPEKPAEAPAQPAPTGG